MPAQSVLPVGLAIPAPWGVFEILLLATFAAHLFVMNVALGGTLLALFAPGPGRGTAGELAGRLPTSLAVTVNLGVPPLLFASVLYGQYLYTAAILSAVAWVSFFLVVMLAYALLYRFQSRVRLPGAAVLAGLAAVLLLAASLVMTNVATLLERPEAWSAYFGNPHGTIVNVADPIFFPRWLHFVVASLAVAGLFLALISGKAAGRGEAEARARLEFGLFVFTRATLVQIVVGGWFLLSLPGGIRLLFLGGDSAATAVLVLGLALAALALWQGFKGAPAWAAACVAGAVCLMVTLRELVRRAFLAPRFLPESLPVAAQTGPLVMFLASLVLVAGAVVWIVAAHARAAQRG
jgi:hypothetical protein